MVHGPGGDNPAVRAWVICLDSRLEIVLALRDWGAGLVIQPSHHCGRAALNNLRLPLAIRSGAAGLLTWPLDLQIGGVRPPAAVPRRRPSMQSMRTGDDRPSERALRALV